MELTEQQAKQYVESDGVRCPFCGSDDIEGESITVDAGRVYQRVLCQVCGESWHDGYTLDSIPSWTKSPSLPAERRPTRAQRVNTCIVRGDVENGTQNSWEIAMTKDRPFEQLQIRTDLGTRDVLDECIALSGESERPGIGSMAS